MALTAERGKFDLVFVADSPGGYANARAALTKHIGYVATSSTT